MSVCLYSVIVCIVYVVCIRTSSVTLLMGICIIYYTVVISF